MDKITPHIYLISGLGADERVFQFLDLSKIEHQFVKWNEPQRNESLASYCKKLTEQINQNQEIILIGVSFGGIIAQEIAKKAKITNIEFKKYDMDNISIIIFLLASAS